MNDERSAQLGMQASTVYALASVGAVSLLSLLGSAYLLTGILRRHTVLMAMVALAVGALLGDAFFHVLPETTQRFGGFTPVMGGLVLAGFLPFFILESLLKWRHSHALDAAADGPILAHDDGHAHGDGHGHETHAQSTHPHVAHPHAAHAHGHTLHPEPHAHPSGPALFGWMNLAGSALHNALDGAVIAAAFLADTGLGITTAIAVGLHEIPHEFGDVAVLLHGGFSPRRAIFFNFLSACLAVVGALIVLLLPFPADTLTAYALPITAGGFLYIAAADLIPELHHHTGDRKHVGVILGGLVAGLALMIGLLSLE